MKLPMDLNENIIHPHAWRVYRPKKRVLATKIVQPIAVVFGGSNSPKVLKEGYIIAEGGEHFFMPEKEFEETHEITHGL